MPSRVVFPEKQRVVLDAHDPGEPAAGQVRLKAICSLMSTGTENICFNQLFEPGTHWHAWVKYPFMPGYATVATVETVGAGVTEAKRGDVVVARVPHASHHVVDAALCFRVPTTVDARAASWFAMAKICFIGARAAGYLMGDDVVIIGAGPIGQMSIRWARALGCQRIIVVDQIAKRLDLACAGGATTTIAKPIGEAIADIVAANKGRRPRVVIDGTGNERVFAHALELVARHGRVVILGDTGAPSQQRLTADVITRGLTIVGAHDGLEDERWSMATITECFFDLVAQGRFSLQGLNTHVFQPVDCAKAYEIANTRRGETMGILFDWTR